MDGEWEVLTMREARISLLDCDHRTPKTAQVGLPYITIPEMKNGEIDLESARKISASDFAEWTKKAAPQPNDILLSRRCNPGETALVRDGQSFAVGQNLVLLRTDGSRVAPAYLRWVTQGPNWWSEVERFRNPGAVFDSLKCREILEFKILIPPIDVQLRIAGLLGALDNKIELNRRIVETLEAAVGSLFKSWFVDFDPVHAKAEGWPSSLPVEIAAVFPKQFEAGDLPRGWRRTCVGDLCSAIFSGGTPSTSEQEYWGGTFPWLSSGETRSNFIIDTEKKITKEGIDGSSTRLARTGSVVIASAGQGHTRGQTSLLLIDSYINQSIVALQANQAVCTDLYLYFNLKCRYDEFRQLSDGQSSRGSLTTKILAGVATVLPPFG
jgi:type I restriction enzyme S subunit